MEVEILFTKFKVAYRNLWHKESQDQRFLEYSKKEWENHLQPFSDAVIRTVTEICENKYELPPTLAQFIGLCRNEVNRHFTKEKKEFKVASPEVAAFNLKQIKEMLNHRR